MKHGQHDLLDQRTFSVQFWALIVDSLCMVGALLAFSNEILLIYIKNKKKIFGLFCWSWTRGKNCKKLFTSAIVYLGKVIISSTSSIRRFEQVHLFVLFLLLQL